MTSTVYIAKNVYGGDGLGRLGDGRVVFVPGAWAGEQVKAEIVEERKHFVKARLVEVVEKSPDRVECAAERVVPGMVYANLSCEGELKAKESQLKEFFERARIEVPEFVSAKGGSEFNYRNKVVYHFARYGSVWRIGYRTEPSHEIVDVADDPLARPEINAKLGEIRRAVTTLLTTGPVQVRKDTERKGSVTVRWTKKSGVKWWIGDAPRDLVLKETTCGLDFEVPVGVLGLCCKPPRLTGIESGRQAIEFAKRNAAAQKAADARFFSEQVGRNVGRIKIGPKTTVVVDPPRGGLEPNVPKWLAAANAPRILYVSCDPATLMRDLRTLAQTYAVESVRWFNMFPRTARFETLVSLRRR